MTKEERIKEFNNLQFPDELMNYLDKYIKFGWIDINKEKHIDTLHEMKNKYIVRSFDEIMESGLGICIDQANLIKKFFDDHNIENHVFCCKHWDDPFFIWHSYVVYHLNNSYYYFEHTNIKLKNIYKFDTLEEAGIFYFKNCSRAITRDVIEVKDLPVGMNMEQLNDYVDSFEKIDTSSIDNVGKRMR